MMVSYCVCLEFEDVGPSTSFARIVTQGVAFSSKDASGYIRFRQLRPKAPWKSGLPFTTDVYMRRICF